MESQVLADIVLRLPQGDDSFTRRMRIHQSWWRHSNGFSPGFGRGGPLGSMLSPVDAAAGHNFLTPGIADLARRKKKQPHIQAHLFDNLLASQPMAFNLLGPLAIDPELARLLISTLLQRELWLAVVSIEETPPDKQQHLDDETSFDATCRFVDAEGNLGMIAIETKLTEPFSPATEKNRPERTQYRDHAERSKLYRDPLLPGFAKSQLWQLWRNHLLLESVCRNAPVALPFRQAWVIHHQDDLRGARDVAAYREQLIAPDDCLREYSLDELTQLWAKVIPNSWRAWLSEFCNRYVDLSGSAKIAEEMKAFGDYKQASQA